MRTLHHAGITLLILLLQLLIHPQIILVQAKRKSTSLSHTKRQRQSQSKSQSQSRTHKTSNDSNSKRTKQQKQHIKPPLLTHDIIPKTITIATGTQITGAGHHNKRNRSIFRNQPDTKHKATNSIESRMFARLTERGQLQFYIPRHDKIISLSVSSDDQQLLHQQQQQLQQGNGRDNLSFSPKLDIQFVSTKQKDDQHEWLPMDGIYGIYMLPSGPHLVLITESQEIYRIDASSSTPAPASTSSTKTMESKQFMNLRKVVAMEIVRIPYRDGSKRHKRSEERRQFGVLRNSLKEHEFYYTAPIEVEDVINQATGENEDASSDGDGNFHIPVVQDVTHTLQRSFVHWTERNEWHKRQQACFGMEGIDTGIDVDADADISADGNKTQIEVEKQVHIQVPMPKELANDTFKDLGSNDNVLNSSLSIMVPSNIIVDRDLNDTGDNDLLDDDAKASWIWAWFTTSLKSLHSGDELSLDDDVKPQQNTSTTDLADGHNEGDVYHGNDREEDSEEDDDRSFSLKPWWSAMQNNDSNDQCIFQRPDYRFFWNEECVVPFLRHYEEQDDDTVPSSSPPACHLLLDYTIPVTSAFVGIQRNIALAPNATTGAAFSVKYDQLLISRRSKYRAGTRFTKRGADSRGDVANFAESEQICIVRNDTANDDMPRVQEIYSHVQTRGSIPLRWSSPTDIKTYRPRVMIGTNPLSQARALRNHLVDQLSLYSIFADVEKKGDVTLAFVNLIDKHSDQGRLGRAFGAVLDAVLTTYQDNKGAKRDITSSLLNPNSVSNIWFDFHAECKKGRWDRLKHLLDDVRPCLDNHGYFCAIPEAKSSWEILGLQNGVVRTNCMDCLDRTNVVQSMFGRYILYQQFCDRFGLKAKSKRKLPLGYNVAFNRKMVTLPWNTGEHAHRLLWADNADAISRLYAGTPALKGDFTRTGKRTKKGALDDGVNSVTRFYLNNFLDADRQEGMDLLTGYAKFDTSDEPVRFDHFVPKSVPQKSKKRFMDLFRREKKLDAIALDSRLSLTWLPGDLQSHMRSSALSYLALQDEDIETDSSIVSLSSALRDIDRRAMLDDPWWVNQSDDEDQDNSSQARKKLMSGQLSILKSSSSGTSLAALIASVKAPIATAIAYICLIVPGLLGDE